MAADARQTEGTIANPARSSGVVGFKPTSGLVSRSGAFMRSEWQDSVGVLAKSVLDASHVWTAISGMLKNPLPFVLMHASPTSNIHTPGHDPDDSLAQPDPLDALARHRPADGTDFREFCNDAALQGMRIAIYYSLLASSSDHR